MGLSFRDAGPKEDKPVQAPLPKVKNIAWVRNSIDRFILAKLEAEKMQPAAEADKRTLLRRLTIEAPGYDVGALSGADLMEGQTLTARPIRTEDTITTIRLVGDVDGDGIKDAILGLAFD